MESSRAMGGDKKLLWIGAAITAAAAIFFPRIEGIRADDESWWRLVTFVVPQDTEGVILVPLVIVLTVALFALLGRWAWNDPEAQNRPAKVGLACGLLGLVGVLAFFLSAPIVLGGLAVTLGLEGRRRAGTQGRAKLAAAAIVVGAVAFAIGAGIWAFSEELSI
jgi:hypothetical protein